MLRTQKTPLISELNGISYLGMPLSKAKFYQAYASLTDNLVQ